MPINHVRKMSVASHRGDCYNYFENTMTAFKKSYEEGVDMIETDVRLTKDLVPVLIHDANVDRTTDGKGRVADYTYEEISKLNAGNVIAPEKIPLFEDFMAWVCETNLTVNIEIKEYNEEDNGDRCRLCIEKVIEIVEKYGMGERILINSFDAYVLEYCYKKWGKRYMLHGFYPYTIMHMDKTEINPDEYLYCACIFDNKNKACYDYLIKRGIEPWIGAAVTSEAMFRLAIGYGARLVTTNNPTDAIEKIGRVK